MQLLSVRQPWAWAIARGRKRVENRTWAPSYRGPVAIYASMRVDLDAAGIVRRARLVYGGVAAQTLRARRAETALEGRRVFLA